MVRVFRGLFLLAGVAFLAACGSEGGSGGGPTTYLTASIKPSTSSVAFVSYSSALKYSPGILSFNVKSNIYSGITPSDVQITSRTQTYTPIAFETYSTNRERLSPTFSTIPVTAYVPFLVPGGGTGTLDNSTVFSQAEVAALEPLVIAEPAKYSKKILKYRLDIRFNGYEVRTNESVSADLPPVEVRVTTP